MRSIFTLTLLISCTSLNAQVYDTLVWADEFNVDGSLDTSKWWQQTVLPNGTSWWNGEIQHYTDRDTNANVSGGNLHLTALRESYSNQGVTKDFTSARLNSKFAFTYGRVEVRAKLPAGVGTWPAIWMLGQNITEIGSYWQVQGYGTTSWPMCGEIDIMEHWGSNQDYVSSAIHSPSSFGGTVNVGGQTVNGASTSFHIYALEWSETKMVFSVDSVVHYTYEPSTYTSSTWPFDDPQFLLLNIAILPSIDTSFTSSSMEVDYVRVYQQSNLSLEEQARNGIGAVGNPFEDQLFVRLTGPSTINLYDITGKQIYSQLHDGSGHLDTEAYAPGLYVLEIIQPGFKGYREKVVKR